jgi:predicted site-specific integrase-resolvase
VKGWAKVKVAAKYAGVSERTLRNWLKDGLKFSRLNSGTVLVRYDDIDDFLNSFAVSKSKVDEIVDSVFKDIR